MQWRVQHRPPTSAAGAGTAVSRGRGGGVPVLSSRHHGCAPFLLLIGLPRQDQAGRDGRPTPHCCGADESARRSAGTRPDTSRNTLPGALRPQEVHVSTMYKVPSPPPRSGYTNNRSCCSSFTLKRYRSAPSHLYTVAKYMHLQRVAVTSAKNAPRPISAL